MTNLQPSRKDKELSEMAAVICSAEPKHCWRNAQLFVASDDTAPLSYVEGFIVLIDAPFVAIEHAWAMTGDGTIIDPTMPDVPAVYFPGKSYDRHFILSHLKWTGEAFVWKTGGFGGHQDLGYHEAYRASMKFATGIDIG